MLPQVKKKVNAFLVGEEGKISKKQIMVIGSVAAGVTIGLASTANALDACTEPGKCGITNQHCNNLELGSSGAKVFGQHAHHINSTAACPPPSDGGGYY